MAACTNHAGSESVGECGVCGRPFCESCLLERGGQRLCGGCRDRELAGVPNGAAVDPRQVLFWARLFDGLAFLGTVAYGVVIGGAELFAIGMVSGLTGSGSPLTSPNLLTAMPTAALAADILGVSAAVFIYLPPLFRLGRGRSRMWGWQMAALVLAATTGAATLPVGAVALVPAVTLFVFWIRPEVRGYLVR